VSTESTDPSHTLGRAVTVRRSAIGMSRKDLAMKSGVSYPYLAAIEKGDRRPSAKILGLIANALGCTVSELHAISETLPDADSPPRGTTWVLQSNARPTSDMFKPSSSFDDSGLIDELRDEVALLRRRIDRMDAELRELRNEVLHRTQL
jgi:transcriptional regulator with XRE-family HTH domain